VQHWTSHVRLVLIHIDFYYFYINIVSMNYNYSNLNNNFIQKPTALTSDRCSSKNKANSPLYVVLFYFYKVVYKRFCFINGPQFLSNFFGGLSTTEPPPRAPSSPRSRSTSRPSGLRRAPSSSSSRASGSQCLRSEASICLSSRR
jgi:hypothetical protein